MRSTAEDRESGNSRGVSDADTRQLSAQDLLPVLQAALDHEAAAANNHQQLLSLLETVLFAGWLALSSQAKGSRGITALAITGILAICFFGVPCVYRRINVDRCRTGMRRIVDDSRQPQLIAILDAARYDRSTFPDGKSGAIAWMTRTFRRLFSQVFERVVLPLIAIGWVVLLVLEDGSAWAISLAGVLVFGWICYLFWAPQAKDRPWSAATPEIAAATWMDALSQRSMSAEEER